MPLKKPDAPTDFTRLVADTAQVRLLLGKLEVDQFAPTIYQAIFNKAYDVKQSEPKAMPDIPVDDAYKDKLKKLVSWFQEVMPMIVVDAQMRYHGTANAKDFVALNYQFRCEKPASFRLYLNRVTQDALGRPPTPEELKIAGANPDVPTVQAHKDAIRLKLQNDWKQEFHKYGLKRFADKLTGAADIMGSSLMADAELKSDVASEFYQRLLMGVEQGESYKDVLLSDKVMVTAKTAPLYGCPAPVAPAGAPAGTKVWKVCDMKAPRGTFFSTLGFLASKPSNFLVDNNNYGRVAAMNEVIVGESLVPNTQGETGEIDPLPACLKTEDHRAIKQDGGAFAPRGSAKVPATGNLCQSCHIRRYLAAGSIVFRPFGGVGDLLSADMILNPPANSDLARFVQEATAAKWVNRKDDSSETPINKAFLASLLNIGENQGQEAGCVPAREGKPEAKITSVRDLAAYSIGDGRTLSKGLSKLLPRALSNLSTTNLEVITSIQQAWQDGEGKLDPVFLAYFTTETYACERQE